MTAAASNGERFTGPTPPARSDDVCEQRLNKALDGLEKAEKALAFAVDEIEARKRLDALKDQIIAVKDIIIAEQDKLIKRLRKPGTGIMARLKRILGVAEKAVTLGLGIYIGKGL